MCNTLSQRAPKRKSSQVKQGMSLRGIAQISARAAAISKGGVNQKQLVQDLNAEEEDDEIKEPKLTIWGAIITLRFSTALVAFCSKFIVNSISDITVSGTVSTTFVGLILLLIIRNAAEHVIAVIVAYKDKISLAINVTIGSSIQIALLVLPFVIILGWIIGQNYITLYFDTFLITILFITVLLVNYLI